MGKIFENVLNTLHKLVKSEPTVIFRRLREVERIVKENPFKDLDGYSGARLAVAFLSRMPGNKPNFPSRSPKEGLEAVSIKNLEVFVVSRRNDNGFYGFPNNFVEKNWVFWLLAGTDGQ